VAVNYHLVFQNLTNYYQSWNIAIFNLKGYFTFGKINVYLKLVIYVEEM